jgi:hypothetical protein
VTCENHIAQGVLYNNGVTFKSIPTPTYIKMNEEINENNDGNNLKGVEVDQSLIHIEK